MTRASAWILAILLLAPAARGAEGEWPESLAGVRAVVRAAAGDVPYNRVKVRRFGNELEISIKLARIPDQIRALQSARAMKPGADAADGETDVFLATNIVDFFEPDLVEDDDVVLFDLTPSANLLTHHFGFVAFNFGNKTKLPAEITVRNVTDVKPEISNRRKKVKLAARSLIVRCVEGFVADEGIYELSTKLGSYEVLSYFCVGCDP